MKKKLLIKLGILLAVFAGAYAGRQWYVLSRVTRSVEAAWRAGMEPAELNLSAVETDGAGSLLHLGFAELVVPGAEPPHLLSTLEGTAVRGINSIVEFAVLPPFDPSLAAAKADGFDVDPGELRQTPPRHSPSPELAFDTILDLQIDLERTLPQPFWQSLFMRPSSFNLYAAKLLTKSMKTGMGMQSVHMFETPATRGLILVGRNRRDTSSAHVTFCDSSGTQAAGLHIRVSGDGENGVMDVLPVIVKSFHFTCDALPSEEQVKALISAAGIPPEAEPDDE